MSRIIPVVPILPVHLLLITEVETVLTPHINHPTALPRGIIKVLPRPGTVPLPVPTLTSRLPGTSPTALFHLRLPLPTGLINRQPGINTVRRVHLPHIAGEVIPGLHINPIPVPLISPTQTPGAIHHQDIPDPPVLHGHIPVVQAGPQSPAAIHLPGHPHLPPSDRPLQDILRGHRLPILHLSNLRKKNKI